jgi:hypothetical protein
MTTQETNVQQKTPVPHAHLAQLRRKLLKAFDEIELRDLCFDLGIRYDILSGQSTSDKARELIAFLQRRNRVSELVEMAAQQRPHLAWGEASESSRIEPHPGNAPPLPAVIVGRDEAIRELKISLGAIAREAVAPSQRVMVIRGWPGVGKTTLVAALAHDPEIGVAFPDGVLWVSLGPTPNLLSELAMWGRALGTNRLMHAATLQEASTQLSAILRDQRRLLIVDDIWDPEHAVPFQVGGRACATLFTTRSTKVAQALSLSPAGIYKLPILTEDKALILLEMLAPSVVAKYSEQSRELVRELEGLPLALQVAGHLLKAEASYGFGVSELLGELRAGTKLLEAQAPIDLTERDQATIPTVTVLLQRSTDRLDQQTRDCFAYLGPFAPKPATFDLVAMKAVWQVEDPKPIARRLVDRGLLEPVGSGRFQMHALLVMHARSLLTQE